jgi:superfamily II DNA/RNA helicase
VARQATASETIEQRLFSIQPTRRDQSAKQKREVLRALIKAEGAACTNAIIFCNRKTEVDVLAKSLKAHGFNASPIHGDLEQSQRTRTLDGFRDGSVQFLIASDVAARGLDIPAVSHIFNFDVPSHAEDYVHRIGRTGRAGRLGKAFTIATPADEKYLGAITALIKMPIPAGALPEGFAYSEAAQQPPRPRDEKPGRGSSARSRGAGSRSRDAERGGRRSESPAPPPLAEPIEAPEVAQLVSVPETAAAAPSVRAPHPEPRSAPRERRDPRERREAGGAVRGMGDHVPDFILRSFRTAAQSAKTADADADEDSGES